MRWLGYPLLSDLVRTSSSPTQVPIYCPHMLQDFLEFAPCGLRTTPYPSCNIPHQHLSPVASHLNLLHTIFSYGLLPGNFLRLPHTATPSIVTPTPFTSTKWVVRHLTTKKYYQVFEKRLDKRHTDVLPPCLLMFTTVTVKLTLHGLLLYGLCRVNFLGVGGGRICLAHCQCQNQ